MGTVCSTDKSHDSDQHDKDTGTESPHQRPVHTSPMQHLRSKIKIPPKRNPATMSVPLHFRDSLASRATPAEKSAAAALARLRQLEEDRLKEKSLDPDDHFLRLAHLIHEESPLFKVAKLMPKAAHLHIHFNSTLLPHVLLGYAQEMPDMYIWCSHRLHPKAPDSNFKDCTIEFHVQNIDDLWIELQNNEQNPAVKAALAKATGKQDKRRLYDAYGPDIYSEQYKPKATPDTNDFGKMRYQRFRELWDQKKPAGYGTCDEWLIGKLVFDREELFDGEQPGTSHTDLHKSSDIRVQKGEESKKKLEEELRKEKLSPESLDAGKQQILEGPWKWPKNVRHDIDVSPFKKDRERAQRAWTVFNGRTKMMKGLFNYQTAFRAYTRECLEEFVRENVQYAEIRPNFMDTNQIYGDDGLRPGNDVNGNEETMKIIIEVYEQFMQDIGDHGQGPNANQRWSFNGLKVIYCMPRSFADYKIRAGLRECIEFKKKWPQYIAGFDLVGQEAYSEIYPLAYFRNEFEGFKRACKVEVDGNWRPIKDKEGKEITTVDRNNQPIGEIPFLFHCGETPDDIEGNLESALEFGARRIGHGYALPTKPDVMKSMKENGVCVEACPISNMVLGLATKMSKHRVYNLLEQNVHCAVSSDNGTLFRSTLSHDFYEIMIGRKDMDLFAWKQLCIWSIEHSCMDQDERKRALDEWKLRWGEFIECVNRLNTGNLKSAHEQKPDGQARRIICLEEAQKKAEQRVPQKHTRS
ncbi:hypothetical protein F4780DRAFT_4634 [Xylariomycetidae sp. FL0641]|nr:hypothetical protein F4780DRAFT_4634 [Xylariomycetidae sp. FL0641]